MKKMTVLVCLALLLGGCASSYGPESWTGGYQERPVMPGVWRIGFYGNGYTNRETVQTYWLYRCAEFALKQGYDGFEIVSDIHLAANEDEAAFIPVKGVTYTYVPIIIQDVAKPILDADIRLLKKPFMVNPPKVFDAAALKARLEPLVKGKLCGGNVCPHDHDYLKPIPQS